MEDPAAQQSLLRIAISFSWVRLSGYSCFPIPFATFQTLLQYLLFVCSVYRNVNVSIALKRNCAEHKLGSRNCYLWLDWKSIHEATLLSVRPTSLYVCLYLQWDWERFYSCCLTSWVKFTCWVYSWQSGSFCSNKVDAYFRSCTEWSECNCKPSWAPSNTTA